MDLLNFFLLHKKRTAGLAKKRLQIVIAEQRQNSNKPDYLPYLKKEILQVIRKYVKINPDMINIRLDKIQKNIAILEFNITLSE